MSGEWTMINLLEPRPNIAAMSVGDVALFAGGWGLTECSSEVDIFNMLSGTWTTTSLSEAQITTSPLHQQAAWHSSSGEASSWQWWTFATC